MVWYITPFSDTEVVQPCSVKVGDSLCLISFPREINKAALYNPKLAQRCSLRAAVNISELVTVDVFYIISKITGDICQQEAQMLLTNRRDTMLDI